VISVKTDTGEIITIHAFLDYTINTVKVLIENTEGIPSCEQTLYLGITLLEDTNTLSDYGIQSGSVLDLTSDVVILQRGHKPVIYLFPPMNISFIHVHLSLVQAWRFSVLYPSAAIAVKTADDKCIGQMATWIVDAKPNGTLFDHGTGREVTYLFWEAIAKSKLLSPAPSRPSSPNKTARTITFDPSRPILSPSNAVLLAFDKVPTYMDDVLLLLGLHTEARTSFITYWLPNMSKHKRIALRFLPQSEFEGAAPLSVSPAPDVITRVFMLFRGVNENDLEAWTLAQVKTNEGPSIWRDIVGVDVDKTTNTDLFRVLEWGGMEVK